MRTDELLRLAVKAALKAGEHILAFYQGREYRVSYKQDSSPVSEADLLACQVIQRMLGTEFPLISEEKEIAPYAERRMWSAYWLVDPLDGTREFIKRNGEFTVNIAFMRNNVPQIGVIYAPAPGLLYYGVAGRGAWRVNAGPGMIPDPDRLVPDRLPLANERDSLVVVSSRSGLGSDTQQFIEQLAGKERGVQVIGAGSSLKMCMVAEGSADYYPRFGTTMEWDIAAGTAIALASGALVQEYPGGNVLEFNKPELRNPWFLVSRPQK